MGTLKEDIKTQSDWIVKAFEADDLTLDYTMGSIMEIDKFFFRNMVNNTPKRGGRLAQKGSRSILFSLGSYVGETIIKNVPESEWITDDKDPQAELNVSMKLPNGAEVWPIQRIMKRFKNGSGDSIYPYVHMATKDFTNHTFDESFWTLEESIRGNESNKPWWKFW